MTSNIARVAGGLGLVVVSLLLISGCSSSSNKAKPATGVTATFTPISAPDGTLGTSKPKSATTTTRPASGTTTTAVAPSTTATAGTTTTVVPIPPAASGYALELYDAWTKGNRPAADEVAEPAAAQALFAVAYNKGDGWTYKGCSGAAGSTYCTVVDGTNHRTITIRVNNQAVGQLHAVVNVDVKST